MGRGYLAILVMLIVVGSGCAGTSGRDQVSRLQSQVGLLDERVSQLERLNPSLSSGSVDGIPAAYGSASSLNAAGAAASAAPASAAASLKPAAREIQQALKNAGFYQGAIDGKAGPLTRDAIKEFQRVHGLTDDGVVGKQTWAKLRTYATLSPSSGEATAAEPLK